MSETAKQTPKVLYYLLSGIQLDFESFDLGQGASISRTYVHVMSHPLLAFERPEGREPHPGPWQPVEASSPMTAIDLYALPEDKRRMVRALAAILRVADGLDRTHFGIVKNVHPSVAPGKLYLDIDSGSERADLELWTSEKRIDLLAKLLGRRIVVRQRIDGRKKSPVLDLPAGIVGRQKAV